MAQSFQSFPPSLLTLSPRLTRIGDPSASVQGINTTPLPDGAFVYCLENKGEYQLDRQDSTTIADGNAVIAPASGPGRWFKRLPAGGGSGAVIQIGEDQQLQVQVPGPAPGAFVLRDGIVDLEVVFSAWDPGDVLLINVDSGSYLNPELSNQIAYDLTPVIDVGMGWQQISPGSEAVMVQSDGPVSAISQFGSMAIRLDSPPRIKLVLSEKGSTGLSGFVSNIRLRAWRCAGANWIQGPVGVLV